MARMFPKTLTPEILGDPRISPAEKKVYAKFKEVLDDKFIVFYSRPWLGFTASGTEKDGECDFVVAHPEYGYCAIEVKGGRINWDPLTNRWTSRDRFGKINPTKDPAKQAVDSKHEILRKCKDHKKSGNRWFGNSHGIIFPDSPRPKIDLRADLPLDIICFYEEFESNFHSWILKRLKESMKHHRSRPLGEDGIQILIDILAPVIETHYCISSKLNEDDSFIKMLTPMQFQILRGLSDEKRKSISGSAGTGKTILAMEEAKRCIDKGERVFLTCYNKALARFMQKELGDNTLLTIETYPNFCELILSEAKINFDPPPPLDDQFHTKYPEYTELTKDEKKELEDIWKFDNRFYRQCPEKIPKACKVLPNRQYDTIIIDEGQDFSLDMLKSLESALDPNGKGKIRLFYDNNQDVYHNASADIEKLYGAPFHLSCNLRNTQKIFKIAHSYYKGTETIPIGPQGEEVLWIEADSVNSLRNILHRYIRDLIEKERISPSDIAILLPRSKQKEEFVVNGRIGGLDIQSCEKHGNLVTIDSIRRFKGLEKSVIIIIVSDELLGKEEWLYVAFSRARTLLVIIGEKNTLNNLNKELVVNGRL